MAALSVLEKMEQPKNTFDANVSDSVVTFLHRMSIDVADRMPDNNELHLPFFSKGDVYEIYVRDFKLLYPQLNAASLCYFEST